MILKTSYKEYEVTSNDSICEGCDEENDCPSDCGYYLEEL